LMACMGLVRVISSPIVGIAADALAARRAMVVGLMGVAAASQFGFAALHPIALIVIFTFISAGAFSAIGPLLDGMTMRSAIAAGMAQPCHSFYYGFGSLNWKALGYPPDLIGILWALGVLAEIALFSVSSRVVARVGATRLLVIGTACGLVRWTVLAFSPPLWI